jgi:menaquinone-9 beta-reductase
VREPEEAFMSGLEPIVDNLVIGGGLAGAMVAVRLAAAGRDVLLLEKEKGTHHKVCGEFLSPEAIAYLRQAGVDPLQLGAVPIHNLRLAARNRVVEAALPFRALSLSRRVLDAALLVRAAEQGCVVRQGVTVDSLSQSGDGWGAELSDRTTLCAQNVFLATGKHDLRGWSRPAGVQGDLVGFKLHWQLTETETDALRESMELFLFSGGYGGIALVEGEVANLCLVVRRARLRKLGGWQELLAALVAENPHIGQRLAGARPLWERPLAISSIPYGYLSGRECGLWCVGDQAAVIPSFTGDGMAIALHSGALAAEIFLAGQYADQYHRRLRAQLTGGMRLATFLSRAMISSTGRELAPFVLASLPKAMRWIANSTRIPESALVPSSLSGGASLKFVEERRKATAGPSTAFDAKNASNSAQDDSAFL